MKWNAELYDNKHAFVFQYGGDVLELLAVRPGERILDLGCGTGHLTMQMKEQGAEVTGIDASPEMVRQARENYPGLPFIIADGTDFHFGDPFDAVFSNATLHWIKDADSVISHVYSALKPGGRFVAEMGGKGNMAQMIAAAAAVLQRHGYLENSEDLNPWYFPSTASYAAKLEAQGFRVTFTAHFDRKTLLQDGRQGVAKWLNMFGQSFFKNVPPDHLQQVLSEISDILEPAYNQGGQWYADYKRLRFIALKD